MSEPKSYAITDSVAGFSEGEILDVTARFGDWHTHDLKLDPSPETASSKKVIVTGSQSGFSEADILDPTARMGDWHEMDLTFDPVGRSYVGAIEDESASAGPIRLTRDQFRAVAEPVN